MGTSIEMFFVITELLLLKGTLLYRDILAFTPFSKLSQKNTQKERIETNERRNEDRT